LLVGHALNTQQFLAFMRRVSPVLDGPPDRISFIGRLLTFLCGAIAYRMDCDCTEMVEILITSKDKINIAYMA
jgi:hypothetical protein